MNITEKQKKILLQYMRENEDLARGTMRYSGENKKILDDLWLTISTTLNTNGNGPKKKIKEWQKTWRDWKSNVLKKCASIRDASDTDGQPQKIVRLTELEEDLLAILDAESTTLSDLPISRNSDCVIQKKSPRQGTLKRMLNENDEPCVTVQLKREKNSLMANISYKMNDEASGTSLLSASENCDDSDFGTQRYETEYLQEMEDNIVVSDSESDKGKILINSLEDENMNSSTRNSLDEDISVHREQARGITRMNRKKEQNTSVDVESMYEQELKIKQERLKISKEKLRLKKEKMEYTKKANADYLNILNNINDNLTLLRGEIEKMTPSYLE